MTKMGQNFFDVFEKNWIHTFFLFVFMALIPTITLSQAKIVEINSITSELNENEVLPFDEHFFLKLKVDKKERISSITVKEFQIFNDTTRNTSIRDFKLTIAYFDSSKNFTHPSEKYSISRFYEPPFGKSGVFSEEGKKPLSFRYEIGSNSIKYEEIGTDKGYQAYIRIPPLDPNTRYLFEIIRDYTTNEKKKIFKIIKKVIDFDKQNVSAIRESEDPLYQEGIKSLKTLNEDIINAPVNLDKDLLVRSLKKCATDTTSKKSCKDRFDDLFPYHQNDSTENDSTEKCFTEAIIILAEEIDKDSNNDPPSLRKFNLGSMGSLESQSKSILTPEFGFLMSTGNSANHFGYITTIGVHINLRPIHVDRPFHATKYKGWRHWTSLYIGTAINPLSDYKVEGELKPLIGAVSIMSGIGIRFSRISRFNIGLQWVKKSDPNPVIDDFSIAFMPYAGITIDLQLQENLPGLFDNFK